MNATPNYLIGYGERLTESVRLPSGFGAVQEAYTLDEARRRLGPMLSSVASASESIPRLAAPDGRAVAALTLHPQYVARSYFPDKLLGALRAQLVGSRPVLVEPAKWGRKTIPDDGVGTTTQLFVAADVSEMRDWREIIDSARDADISEVARLEEVHLPRAEEKVRSGVATPIDPDSEVFEVVLHASDDFRNRFVLSGFEAWCESIGAQAAMDRRISSGGLTFLPVAADPGVVEQIAEFSFLRVARPMPQLRVLRPMLGRGQSADTTIVFPKDGPLDPTTRAVVFDGGLDGGSALSTWSTSHETSGIGPADPLLTAHGHMVTSAVLFGSLHEAPQRPYAGVDHYRVLDTDSENDPYELYSTLDRIREVLSRVEPQFVNMSIGPHLPVEDDEVHAWTAVVDEYISSTQSLVVVAAGNDGDLDWGSGNARIQVPADSVNALTVGASALRTGCRRATYSSVGPGRSPGVIKPDIVAFGGELAEPFVVSDPSVEDGLMYQQGTSFSAPNALRTALGVRAHLGDVVSPMTLKALLVHCAEADDVATREVGWGAIPADIADIVVCGDGSARVLYQGTIDSAKYLRAPIPLPSTPLKGLVTIDATFTYACEVDPQDPAVYTRSGLEIYFRPHAEKFNDVSSTEAKTVSFFGSMASRTEQQLRSDAHKWETVLHRSKRFQARSLLQPVFDIHHLARIGGGDYGRAPRVRYSLVITVSAPRVPDLYDQVLRSYPTQLQALSPVVDVQVRGTTG